MTVWNTYVVSHCFNCNLVFSNTITFFLDAESTSQAFLWTNFAPVHMLICLWIITGQLHLYPCTQNTRNYYQQTSIIQLKFPCHWNFIQQSGKNSSSFLGLSTRDWHPDCSCVADGGSVENVHPHRLPSTLSTLSFCFLTSLNTHLSILTGK